MNDQQELDLPEEPSEERTQPGATATPEYGLTLNAEPDGRSVPAADQPGLGAGAGVAVWLTSVGAIILLPLLALLIWYFISVARGMQQITDQKALIEWAESSSALLVQVLGTLVAHVLTIAVCWAVVTRMGKRPFFASLGWHWAGRSPLYWVVLSALIIVCLIATTPVLMRLLPQTDNTPMQVLLRSSTEVRIALVVVATLSAPFVEEIVYRGVLFAGVRERLGTVAGVIFVTIVFAGVHLPQNRGAWVSMAELTLLSLALTLLRAYSGSILPSVVLHLMNNGFESVLILLKKG